MWPTGTVHTGAKPQSSLHGHCLRNAPLRLHYIAYVYVAAAEAQRCTRSFVVVYVRPPWRDYGAIYCSLMVPSRDFLAVLLRSCQRLTSTTLNLHLYIVRHCAEIPSQYVGHAEIICLLAKLRCFVYITAVHTVNYSSRHPHSQHDNDLDLDIITVQRVFKVTGSDPDFPAWRSGCICFWYVSLNFMAVVTFDLGMTLIFSLKFNQFFFDCRPISQSFIKNPPVSSNSRTPLVRLVVD